MTQSQLTVFAVARRVGPGQHNFWHNIHESIRYNASILGDVAVNLCQLNLHVIEKIDLL